MPGFLVLSFWTQVGHKAFHSSGLHSHPLISQLVSLWLYLSPLEAGEICLFWVPIDSHSFFLQKLGNSKTSEVAQAVPITISKVVEQLILVYYFPK